MAKSGMYVTTKAGNRGMVYNNKGVVNGKIPVYVLANPLDESTVSDKAILCDPKTLTHVGFFN